MIGWTIRVLLAVSALLIAATGALLFIEPQFDLTPRRDSIAGYLSRAVGREVRLDGEIQVTLGRHLRVAVSDVGIANAPWAGPGRLFSAAQAGIGVDLFALLSGVIHIEDLVLRRAGLSLAVAASGERNWDMGAPDARDTDGHGEADGWSILLEEAVFEDVALVYQGPGDARPLQLHLDRIEQNNEGGILVLKGAGRANQLPVAVRGRVGPLQALFDGRDIDADMRAEFGETVIDFRGHFGEPARLEDIALEATVRGPSLARLLDALGIAGAREGDMDLALKVTDRDRGFAWESSGRLGSVNIDTHGEIARPLELDDFRVSARLSGEDLAGLGHLLGIRSLPSQPFLAHGEVSRDDHGLVLRDVEAVAGDTRLALSGRLPVFPKFDQADSQLDILIPDPARFAGRVGANLAAAGPLRASVRLSSQADGSGLLDADATLGKNRLTLRGPVGDYPGYRETRLGFELSGPSLGALGKVVGVAGLPVQDFRAAGLLAVDRAGRLTLQLREGKTGHIAVSAQGTLGSLPELDTADLSVSLRGSSLQQAAGSGWPAQPFELEARLLGRLRAPTIDRVSASLGRTRIEANGRIGTPPRFAGTDARFNVQVPELNELLDVPVDSHWGRGGYRVVGRLRTAGKDLVFDDVKVEGERMKLTLAGKVRDTARGFAATDLVVKVGGGEVSGQISVEQRKRRYVDLTLNARGVDLHTLLPPAQHQAQDAAAKAVEASAKPRRLIPDSALPVAFLDALDGRFRVKGEALGVPDPVFPHKVAVREFGLDATLNDGSLVLQQVRVSGDRGTITGHGTLKRSGQDVEADWAVKAVDFRYGLLAEGEGLEQLPRHELDATLASQGRSYRELAAKLNGQLKMTGGGGRVLHAGLDKTHGTFLNDLVTTLNPFSKQETHTQVDCSALVLSLSDGVARLDPGFVIRTDRIDIAAGGIIDLKTERLDVQFKSSPRKGIGLSAAGLVRPYVKVGGTLAEPGLVLDAPGALISGTAAVATSGLSILATGLFDRLTTSMSNPCLQLIEAAGARAGKP